MDKAIEEILIEQVEIKKKVQELAEQISRDYLHKKPHIICVLKGAVFFLADLTRALTIPVTVDFMAVSSYGSSTETSGVVRIIKDLDESIQGRDILIVEDIIDTGLTLHYLQENLSARGPASIKVCTLLDKPSKRKAEVSVAYCGFAIPDKFVVGYGLDYAEDYRNLPYIGILKEAYYK